MDVRQPLDSFNGLGEGMVGSVAISGGSTIDEITISYTHSAAAGEELDISMFDTVRFNLGTEAIVDVTGEELRELCQDYLGIHTEDGQLVIPFKEIAARTYDGVHMTGLVTFPSDALSLDVKLVGTGASANLDLRARASFSASQTVRRVIPKIKTQSFPVTASGEVDLTTLPKGPRIKRIHFADGEMDTLRILRDDVEIYNEKKADVVFEQKRHGRVPQTDYFHLDSSPDGFNVSKAMVTSAGKLVLKPGFSTLTAPTSVRMVIESVHAANDGATKDVATRAVATNRRKRR